MEPVHDDQRLLVKRASIFPGGFPEGPEVTIPQVFDDDETGGRIVADQPGSRNIYILQKAGDFGIIGVLYPLGVVMD
jgi:hypothetical protein